MKTAIIMCVWQRIGSLSNTIDMLSKQDENDFNFFIWNNNANIKHEINTLIKQYEWVQVHHSPTNIGGIGRFHYAHKIHTEFEHIIFIDDDQQFDNTFVKSMIVEYEPKTIKSWFSWKFNNSEYWQRIRVRDGSNVHYCGTGGMILDSSIFVDEKILTDCPIEYTFVEDLWLSFYANHVHKYKLKSTKHVNLSIVVDGKDQYVKLRSKKPKFLKYLLNTLKWELI